MKRLILPVLLATLFSAQGPAQTTQAATGTLTSKANSNAEAAALGYMRTVINAQKVYKKKRGTYATSLAALVGSASFTKRMANPDRGNYVVTFRAQKDGYSLALTPKSFDAQHRAFFTDESGNIRVEDAQQATATSPLLK